VNDAPNTSSKALPGSRSEARYPLYACMFMVFVNVGRVQEILPWMTAFRLGLLSITLAFALALASGRLSVNSLWNTRETKLVLLLWLLGFLSIPLSVWPGGALLAWRTTLTSYALIFLICLANARTEKELWRIIRAVVVSALFLGTSADFLSASRLAATTTYDPNDLALILAVVLPLAYASLRISNTPALKVFHVLVILYMLILLPRTQSRGGLIGFLAGCMTNVMLERRTHSISKKAALIAAAAMIVYFAAPESLWDRFSLLLTGQDYNLTADLDHGQEGRISLWGKGLILIIENPFLGVGIGQASNAMGLRFGSHAWRAIHNSCLQIALDLGLLGLLLFVLMFLSSWQNCTRVLTSADRGLSNDKIPILAVSIQASLVAYAVSSFFLSQAYCVLFPLLLALSHSLSEQLSQQQGGAAACITNHTCKVSASIPGRAVSPQNTPFPPAEVGKPGTRSISQILVPTSPNNHPHPPEPK